MSPIQMQNVKALPTLDGPIIEPQSGDIRHMVIFLHGYGADGQDLISLSESFKELSFWKDCLFASPDAPFPFELAPFGRQWFSLQKRDFDNMFQGAQIAAPVLDKYIDEMLETYDLKSNDLILVGFSQGTMMALHTALRRKEPLGGIVGFSGSFLHRPEFGSEIISKTPTLLIHGQDDSVVPFSELSKAKDSLTGLGIPTETLSCPQLDHGISYEGIVKASQFLDKRFKPAVKK